MTRALRVGGAARTAAFGLTLCLLGGGFGSPALYLPGVALLLLSAAAPAWVVVATRKTRVSRTASHSTVEEGVPLRVHATVRRGPIPLPGAELLAMPTAPPTPVGRGRSTSAESLASFARRGRQLLEPAVLRVHDPLGLAEARVCSPPADVLVLPRVEPVKALTTGGWDGSGRAAGRASPLAAALEVDSLRPHRAGSPASRIHWPAVARTGTLLERGLVADTDRRPLIVVDPRAASSAEDLDRALRAASSLCVHLATQGGVALLLPGAPRTLRIEPGLQAWPAAHARLALVTPSDGAPVAGRVQRAGEILWVTASPAGLPSGLARAAARERYLVSPHPLPGRPLAFTVAGCAGQRVGVRAGMRAGA